MALFNVHSLSNESFIINDLILQNNLDCLFLTETWLSTDAPAVLTETSPPNFSFLFSNRSGRRGGGTATIISNSIITKDISFNNYTSFEQVGRIDGVVWSMEYFVLVDVETLGRVFLPS